MKRFHLIIGILAIACSGCSKDDTTQENQRLAFQNYLSAQQLEYVEQSGVYKVVTNASRTGYSTAPVLETGDQAVIQFAVSAFTSSGSGTLYYTNVLAWLPDGSVLNPQYWDLNPRTITLDDSRLIKGVRLGLEKCREGDSVQLYVVSELGYGDKPVGIVPDNTPLFWNIVIDSVIKK